MVGAVQLNDVGWEHNLSVTSIIEQHPPPETEKVELVLEANMQVQNNFIIV